MSTVIKSAKTFLIISGLMMCVVIITGCATPVAGEWHNTLYVRDYQTTMKKYYGRDFSICLNRAVETATSRPGLFGTIEQKTDQCLSDAGWFRVAE